MTAPKTKTYDIEDNYAFVEPGQGSGHGPKEIDDHIPEAPDEDMMPDEKEIDDWNEAVSDSIRDKKEVKYDEKGKKTAGGGSAGKGGHTKITIAVDWEKKKPKTSWKDIINRLFVSGERDEETWTKGRRSDIASAHNIEDDVPHPRMPGEKAVKAEEVKICVCIDTSGSMMEVVSQAFQEISQLLDRPELATTFYVINFSGAHIIDEVTLPGKTARELKSGSFEPTGQTKTLKQVLASQGNVTNFTPGLAKDLHKLLAESYNVLIISDTDIIQPGVNLKTLNSLLSQARDRIYILAANQAQYVGIMKALGWDESENIGHLEH